MTQANREYWLLSVGKTKKKVYCMLFPFEDEIWVDLKCLPQTCFLCACCDGVGMQQVKVSAKSQRYFLPMKWLLDGWGASKEYTDPLRQLKERMEEECKRIREEKHD